MDARQENTVQPAWAIAHVHRKGIGRRSASMKPTLRSIIVVASRYDRAWKAIG